MNSFVSIHFSFDWGLKMKRQQIVFLAFIFCIASIDKSVSAPTKDTLGIPPQGVDGEENVLQKHVTFFDRNKDGIIYPWETFEGFRAIGCGYLLSSVAAIFINAGLSGKTRPGKFPSLLFPIEVRNIQKGKHGSDSGVYDSEGRFVPSKFEEIFSKHARANANTLTGDELMGLLKANRVPKDYGGWLASYTEWKILYVLCKDKKGLLHRDTIRAVYDGSLFEKMAKEKASAGQRNVASAEKGADL